MDVISSFVNGEWVQSQSRIANKNPSDLSEVSFEYSPVSLSAVDDAIALGVQGQAVWADFTLAERADVLGRVAQRLKKQTEPLARTISLEQGKVLAEARIEVRKASEIFSYFAGEALRIGGDYLPSLKPDSTVQVSRAPMGVVAAITPWNFPIVVPAWKIAAALAFGNAVIFKPSELTPATSAKFAAVLIDCGVPKAAFSMLLGLGSEIGERIVGSTGINAISFTGSQTVGTEILLKAAQNFTAVQLEMGGKNPLLILDDADVKRAVYCAVQGAFFSAGQRCTATSRIIVTEGIYDRFVPALLESLGGLRVGHALDPDVDIGPLASPAQLAKTEHYVELGKKEGAVIAFGGGRLKRPCDGYYHQPTLFTDTHPNMTINTEEIFGPVAAIIRVKTYDEALETANSSHLGLSSGICTSSLKYAEHFKNHSAAGLVMVNMPTVGVDYHVPFGGWKASGYGSPEQGSYARNFYTKIKTAYTAVV